MNRMFAVRDVSNELWIFSEKPIRNKYVLGSWGCENICGFMKLDYDLFPDLKWEDEPIEIELVPKMMNAVQEKLAESVNKYFDIHPYNKKQEQNYYDDIYWRWQDWKDIKYDHPSTWDLNFDDYVGSKR